MRRSSLCSICKTILCHDTSDTSKDYITPYRQTWDVFKDAVQNGCFICSLVWELSRDYRQAWSECSELWKPMHFRPYRFSGEENIIKLSVLYTNPTTKEFEEARFRLISPDDMEFGPHLRIPTINTAVKQSTAMTQASEWLTHCLSTHQNCVQPRQSGPTWYPTRLIDIGEVSGSNWRLIVVSEDGILQQPAKYITLSYRWGTDPKPVLSSSNISKFRQGGSVSDLPTLFQDTITLAQHLSVRYIWVDALCIIQDCKQDWKAEVPKMGYVYANSLCNIAASASKSPHESLFFTQRNRSLIMPGLVDSSLFSSKSRSLYIFDKTYLDRQLLDGPLHKRGWVFQERFLSSRVLYFTKYQLFWECITEHKCEVFPRGIPVHSSHKSRDRILNHSSEYKVGSRGITSTYTLSLWNDLVEEYSHCNLTNPSDKLFAMAGIAAFFRDITGDNYVAGLWKSKLVDMLDWRVHKPKPRHPMKCRAPSWSWASIDGPIRFGGTTAAANFLVELVQVGIADETSTSVFAVMEESITLRGKVFLAVCQCISNGFVTFQSGAGLFKVQVYLDYLDINLTEGETISYIPLKLDHRRDGKHSSYSEVICLIVVARRSAADCQHRYCRLGHFIFIKDDEIERFCFGGQTQSFKII